MRHTIRVMKYIEDLELTKKKIIFWAWQFRANKRSQSSSIAYDEEETMQPKKSRISEMQHYLTTQVKKLVLHMDETTKIELISVDHKLVQKLKTHQLSGVKFSWNV